MTPEAFVQTYGPQAQAVAQQTGIPADVMLAIAANETGWGLPTTIGFANNAWFGEKSSGSAPAGDAGVVTVPTQEFINGAYVTVSGTFNQYSSFAAAAQGFVRFLQNNSRYATALNLFHMTGDSQTLVHGLAGAGYATSPTWANQINSIVAQIDRIGVPGATDVGSIQLAPQVQAAPGVTTTVTAGSLPAQSAAGANLDFTGSWMWVLVVIGLMLLAVTLLGGGIYLVGQSRH